MAITTAIVGLGGIAQKAYLPILSNLSNLELLLFSRSPGSVFNIQSQYRIPRGTKDLDELINWHPQVAFVLTPSSTHREIVERLLSSGIDVYVEKPLTLTLEDSYYLAELADKNGRVLMVGFNRRFAPLNIQARELWGKRQIGMAIFQKHRASAYHPNLYQNYIDDTIHIIDLLRFFCGEAKALHTTFRMQKDKLTCAESAVAFDTGGIGLVLTTLQAGDWSETYTIHGEETSLFVDAFRRLTLVTGDEKRVWDETYASTWRTNLKARGFVDEIGHFYECVHTRAQPLASAWEALKTQQLLEEMVRIGKE